jgi:hypothetical protein
MSEGAPLERRPEISSSGRWSTVYGSGLRSKGHSGFGNCLFALTSLARRVYVLRKTDNLALDILLFARQSAREDLNVAKVMFAMTADVAGLIASLYLSQIRAIASANTSELKVRWDNDPELWRDLLIAARAGDEQPLAAVRRQAKLLFLTQP